MGEYIKFWLAKEAIELGIAVVVGLFILAAVFRSESRRF